MSFDSKIFWHKTDEFNREMINGARRGGRTLKNKLNELQIVDTRDLVNFVGYQTRKRNGEIYALAGRYTGMDIFRSLGQNQ